MQKVRIDERHLHWQARVNEGGGSHDVVDEKWLKPLRQSNTIRTVILSTHQVWFGCINCCPITISTRSHVVKNILQSNTIRTLSYPHNRTGLVALTVVQSALSTLSHVVKNIFSITKESLL